MPCGFSQLEGMQDVVDDFGHCDWRHRPKSERDRMVSIVELKCYLGFWLLKIGKKIARSINT